jgi:hypothetical protein
VKQLQIDLLIVTLLQDELLLIHSLTILISNVYFFGALTTVFHPYHDEIN